MPEIRRLPAALVLARPREIVRMLMAGVAGDSTRSRREALVRMVRRLAG
ncbi:hypothetical protein ABZ260_38535 [Streptosporangium sp. NPDC006013]